MGNSVNRDALMDGLSPVLTSCPLRSSHHAGTTGTSCEKRVGHEIKTRTHPFSLTHTHTHILTHTLSGAVPPPPPLSFSPILSESLSASLSPSLSISLCLSLCIYLSLRVRNMPHTEQTELRQSKGFMYSMHRWESPLRT